MNNVDARSLASCTPSIRPSSLTCRMGLGCIFIICTERIMRVLYAFRQVQPLSDYYPDYRSHSNMWCFGDEHDAFVVQFDSPELSSEIVEKKSAVSGNIVPISELESVTDWASVKKVGYLGFSSSFLRSSTVP